MHFWIDGLDRHSNRADRGWVEQRASKKVSRHSKHVQSIAIVTRDINGPRGGIDRVVRVLVRLKSGGSIIARHRAIDVPTGVPIALARAVRAMRRDVGRRRSIRRNAFRRNLAKQALE